MNRRNDQVTFVLSVVIIGHDDDFAGFESADGVDNAFLVIGHGGSLYFKRAVWPRSRR